MSIYKPRLFDNSDADYAAGVSVHNADVGEGEASVEIWQHYDANREARYFWQRTIVEIEEKGEWRPVLAGGFGDVNWVPAPGRYFFSTSIHPEHQNQEVQQVHYDFVLAKLAEREQQPTELYSFAYENQPERIRFLEEKGFKAYMRFPISQLDVTTFDAEHFTGLLEKVTERGFEILTLAELRERDPDWAKRSWEMMNAARRDLPSPEPVQDRPFEEYMKNFSNPQRLEDGYFIGIHTGGSADPAEWTYAGMSALWKAADEEKLLNGFTGVLRAYRRQGLATAMKLRGIAFAQAYGARLIETDNEENNPMYQINLALGFEPKPAMVDYKRPFTAT